MSWDGVERRRGRSIAVWWRSKRRHPSPYFILLMIGAGAVGAIVSMVIKWAGIP